MAAAVGLYQADASAFIINLAATLGLVGLFASVYLSLRRSALSSAEAVFIGMTLIGTVLMLLVAAVLID